VKRAEKIGSSLRMKKGTLSATSAVLLCVGTTKKITRTLWS